MSKPRYNWWPFALNMIRDYPAREAQYRELHRQNITANTSGMPGGGGASRTTETIALRQLPPQEQREYDAVHKAVDRIRRRKDGKLRYSVVKMTLWQGYNIAGAALVASVSEHTARRYRWQFVLLVGHIYGFLTEQEYMSALKKDTGTEKLGS